MPSLPFRLKRFAARLLNQPDETIFHGVLGMNLNEVRRLRALVREHPLGAAHRLLGRRALERWDGRYYGGGKAFIEPIAKITGAGIDQVRALMNEPAVADLGREIQQRAPKFGVDARLMRYYGSYRLFYYALLRLVKPMTLVETGTWWGVSSSYILTAFEQNQRGRLFSIDLQNGPTAPQDRVGEVGALVPERLRHRWELHLGASEVMMPRVLEKLGQLDMFIHDSDHSVENMLFEMRSAYPRLRSGGILIADDIEWNDAFRIFCEESCQPGDRITIVKRGWLHADMGIIIKDPRPRPAEAAPVRTVRR